jgi:DNA topoisomerase I
MAEPTEEIKIPKSKLRVIANDPVKSAAAVNLVYVNDTEPGVTREKKGDKWEYYFQGKKIVDDEELIRFKRLVIPPAWQNVWICPKENGHLQATGIDARGRKQYKYHPLWNTLRNQTKFFHLLEFGKALPQIRLHLEKDLSLPGLPLNKVLAAVVSLMERTHIRIGNNIYEKLYGSFGLTTLKDKHVEVDGQKIKFEFKGKKGVMHSINIKSKKLAGIVKKCRDIPGRELFQYIDENGEKRSIDSGMVNDYIKTISGGEFTAKDFRTWAGTVQALLSFRNIGPCESEAETKRKIVECLDCVSKQLGNTRTVCKKYYVHPRILSLFETQGLQKYIQELDAIEVDDNKSDLTGEEKVLMKILSAPAA